MIQAAYWKTTAILAQGPIVPTHRTEHEMNGIYIRPSQCELCVPVETIVTSSATSWHTEVAHENECPNSPMETK